MQTVTQPTGAPTNKVTAAAITSALLGVILYIVKATSGFELPGDVTAAILLLLNFVVSYFVKDAPNS